MGLMLTLSLINPLYNGTRHLLIGLPPFLLLVAAALGADLTGLRQPVRSGWRVIRPFFLLFVVVSQLAWLQAKFTAPELVRDDVRGAAQYLSEMAAPDDIIVVHDTLIRFTFDYYYDGPAPVISVPL
jgi:hypothetical protein